MNLAFCMEISFLPRRIYFLTLYVLMSSVLTIIHAHVYRCWLEQKHSGTTNFAPGKYSTTIVSLSLECLHCKNVRVILILVWSSQCCSQDSYNTLMAAVRLGILKFYIHSPSKNWWSIIAKALQP